MFKEQFTKNASLEVTLKRPGRLDRWQDLVQAGQVWGLVTGIQITVPLKPLSSDPWPLSPVLQRERLSQCLDLCPDRLTKGSCRGGWIRTHAVLPHQTKLAEVGLALRWDCRELQALHQPGLSGQHWQLDLLFLVFSKVKHWGPYHTVFLYSPASIICFAGNRSIFFCWPSHTW